MTLRVARARLLVSSALGLGIGVVLAAATLISRRFIEAPGFRSQPPVLRSAAVFAPTLLVEVAGPREIDAVTGQDSMPPPPPPPLPSALAHTPQAVPEELLLSLAPATNDPSGGLPDDEPAPRHLAPRRPAAAAPEPRLELIDDNLWKP